MCLTTSSRRNSASSRCRLSRASTQRVAAADAEEQRDFAEARLEVDDHRRPLAQARELDGAVHRDGRRAGAALGAEEHDRRRRRRVAADDSSARRRPADRVVERLSGGGHVKNSFAPARIDWRIRSGFASRATTKMRDAPTSGAQRFDGRHRRRIASARASTTTRSARGALRSRYRRPRSATGPPAAAAAMRVEGVVVGVEHTESLAMATIPAAVA